MSGDRPRLVVDVGVLAKEIHLGAHVECVARGCLAKRDIDRQAVVVHPAAVAGVAHIDVFAGARNRVPHLLLHAHRACRVIDLQAQFWP